MGIYQIIFLDLIRNLYQEEALIAQLSRSYLKFACYKRSSKNAIYGISK